MGFLSSIVSAPGVDRELDALSAALDVSEANNGLLEERIAELELALEDAAWDRLTGMAEEMKFSRDGLDKIIRQARLYYLKNPVIRRPVDLQAYYVWGQGVSIRGEGAVGDVVRGFLADPANENTLNSHQARMRLEKTIAVDGNLFLRFVVGTNSGRVKVRTLDVNEIREIIKNPNDRDEVWFYRRKWQQKQADPNAEPVQREVLYPDWQYWRERTNEGDPAGREGVGMTSYQGTKVDWETPVMHVKVGTIGEQDFGIPEVYPALDWAKAYKESLEDYKKIVRSLARWAWHLKTGGTQPTVDAAVAKLQSSMSDGTSYSETNPAPVAGSVFVGGAGVDLRAVDVSKAVIDPEGFKRILLMAATSMGLSEIMYGDADVGNLATATAMDRPTELKFVDRQKLWTNLLQNVFSIILDAAARAPGNTRIKSRGIDEVTGLLKLTDATGAEVNRVVTVDFPPILQRDPQKQVQALVSGLTLNGQPIQIGNDGPTILRLLLTTLGVDDVEEVVEKFYPTDGSEPDLKPIPVLGIDTVAGGTPPSNPGPSLDSPDEEEPRAGSRQQQAAETALAKSLDAFGAVVRSLKEA